MPSQIYKITVAKPCHEDWENMLPVKDGRHCNSCQKNVIDFSLMTDEAVKNYFIDNKGAAVCGRFKNTQIERIRIDIPTYVFQKRIRPWKKYLVILLLCFGSTVLPIDVFLGGGNLYAQTQVANKHFTKKKYRNRYNVHAKINCKIDWKVYPIYTTGFTVRVPETLPQNEPPLQSVSLSNATSTSIVKDSNSTSFNLNTTPNGKNEPPGKEQSKNDTEFILPVPLVMRRRGRRKF